MDLTCEERGSDSPVIERIWRSRSEQASAFVSMADTHWGIVVTRYQGRATLTVRGPETRASAATTLADAEWIGVQFKPGTLMPLFPVNALMDRRDVNLPEATAQRFWLNGSAWDFPDYDNIDTFVQRLMRDNLLLYDPMVEAVLAGQPAGASLRTAQRRFLKATGLTHGTMRQIDRARHATLLLKQGVSILDTVAEAGYADQPHLTRSLGRFAGQTPAQLLSHNRTDTLSFLFKTDPV